MNLLLKVLITMSEKCVFKKDGEERDGRIVDELGHHVIIEYGAGKHTRVSNKKIVSRESQKKASDFE